MVKRLVPSRALGEELVRLRTQKNISQERLCAMLQCRGCDIGRSTYAKYEAGTQGVPLSVMRELDDIFGCHIDVTAYTES